MSDESNVWKNLSSTVGKRAHMTRIESHATSIGQPDVNYCMDGHEGNVELKHTDSSKKGLTLRPSQWQWFKKRVEAGGTPWVLALVDIPLQKPYYILVSGKNVIKHELVHHKSITKWKEAGEVVETLTFSPISQMMMLGKLR